MVFNAFFIATIYPKSGLQCTRVTLLEVQNNLQIQWPNDAKALPQLNEKLFAILDAGKVEDIRGLGEGLAVDVERPDWVMILECSLDGYNHVFPGHRRGDEKVVPILVEIGAVQRKPAYRVCACGRHCRGNRMFVWYVGVDTGRGLDKKAQSSTLEDRLYGVRDL
jgi:hypothetical protein